MANCQFHQPPKMVQQFWKIEPLSLLLLLAVLLFVPLSPSCISGPGYEKKPTVTLAWQRKAQQFAILVRHLELQVHIQPPGPMPYSDNSSTAIWLGTKFPHDKAIQLIRWGHNYYKELRYIALSDLVTPSTERYDYDLFLGGATRKALQLQLKAWTPADFKKLYRAKDQEQFHALIRSRYGKN